MPTTSANIAQLLGTAATAYGVLAAFAVLLQARQMLARRASCEVSGPFFASYAGGYAIWLLYGLSVRSAPLIIVDAVGLLCAGLTLAVALSLRGSLIHPATWRSCDSIPVSEKSSARYRTGNWRRVPVQLGPDSLQSHRELVAASRARRRNVRALKRSPR
jgi:uncharacterized protein with PQ loop repeat